MPQSPRRPCSGIGPRRGRCTNLVAKGTRCCDECLPHLKQQTRRYDIERDKGEGRQFLHSTTWRAIRLEKLWREPLCYACSVKHRDVPAVLVHHKDRDETNCDDSNLVSLCVACHEEEHRNERWGR